MIKLAFNEHVKNDEIGEKFQADIKEALGVVFKNKIPVADLIKSASNYVEQIKNLLQYTYEAPRLRFYPTGGIYGEGELIGSIVASDDVEEWASRPMIATYRLQVQTGYVEKFGL